MHIAAALAATTPAHSGGAPGSVRPAALCEVAGEPLLVRAVRAIRASGLIGALVVAAPVEHVHEVREVLRRAAPGIPAEVVAVQAPKRSLAAALDALSPRNDGVLVHDAARAFATPSVVQRVVAALQAGAEAVVPVMPVTDTVKQVDGDRITATLDRSTLYAVQTPQGFRRDVLLHAAASAPGDDTAGLPESLRASGVAVTAVRGCEEAFAVTSPFDLTLAEALARSERGGVPPASA